MVFARGRIIGDLVFGRLGKLIRFSGDREKDDLGSLVRNRGDEKGGEEDDRRIAGT